MEQAIKDFVKTLKEEHRQAIRAGMKEVARRVEKDFKEEAKRCIDNYYKEYSPTVYERTDRLRDHGILPYKRYRLNEIDVGVAFSPMEIPPYDDPYGNAEKRLKGTPFKTIEDLVVGNAMEGIHGHKSVYVGKSIHETMQSFRDVYSAFFLDEYFKATIDKYILWGEGIWRAKIDLMDIIMVLV